MTNRRPTPTPSTGSTGTPEADSLVGQRYEVEVGPVAHGGHCVARHEGRVLFVRHALPGERVVAEVTDGTATSRFLRADAVEVLTQLDTHYVSMEEAEALVLDMESLVVKAACDPDLPTGVRPMHAVG